MKKNKLNLLLTGLLSLMVVGCTSETEDIIGGGAEGDLKTITIQLPKMKGAGTSYATPAEPTENELQTLKVYVINGSTVEDIKDATIEAGKTTATVQVTGSGTRDFYLVANASSTELNNINKGATLANLQAAKTNALTKTDDLKTPLLMDGSKTGVTLSDGATFDVTMKRRVARFDVVNKADTKFTIESVLVSKARTRAYVLTPSAELTTPVANMAAYAYPNAQTSDSVAAAFYLNPTELGDGKTEISFKGTDGKLYAVKSTAKISANKRYIIRLSKSSDGTVSGSVTVDPNWDDEDLGADEVAGTLSAALLNANGATLSNGTLDMTNATGDVSFTATTTTSTSTPVTVTKSHASIVVSSTAPALSYAAVYEQKHTITVPISLIGNHTVTFADKSGNIGDGIAITGPTTAKFVNPLTKFTKGNLMADYTIGADLKPETAGLTTSYGAWFQWGRKSAFTNPSSGTPRAPIAFNVDSMVTKELDGSFFGGANQYTWHTAAGSTDDVWTKLASQGQTTNVDSDPCPAGYRVPTVDEWLAIIPHNSTVGNYTGTTGKGEPTGAKEREGNQITAETGPAIYFAGKAEGEGAAAVKTLYAIKKHGTDAAYALRWSYKGTGKAFEDQMTTTGGDTYLEIACIKATADGSYASADDVAALFDAEGATPEVRYFPAAGYRDLVSGLSTVRSADGYYWSSSSYDGLRGSRVVFHYGEVVYNATYRTFGFSIRCVAQ